MEKTSVIITPEILKQDGWTLEDSALFSNMWCEELQKFIYTWSKTVDTDSGRVLFCTIQNVANRDDCEYNVHVDNSSFQSVGSMDIRTLAELHGFLDLLTA